MPVLYLDNAASTRPSDPVIALIAEVMAHDFGNPSSTHPAGVAARRRIEVARAQLLAAIGDPDGALGDIVWTSGGTEADALGVLGAARARGGGGAVVVSALEHGAVARTAERAGPVRIAPASSRGVVEVAPLLALVDDATAVVALMRVQNELGTLQPVGEVAAAVRARAPRCHLHCDAIQALGKIDVDVAALGCDSVAFAGHKLHGPKGVGALWLRHGAAVEPLWDGGGQQRGLRAGTQDAPGVAGMGLAVAAAVADLPAAQRRWGSFAEILRAALASTGVEHVEVPPGAERVASIVAIALRGIPASALRNTLASRGVAVSTGSACAERDSKPSPVLAAIGLAADWGMVRVSFGHDTTAAEVDAGAAILAEVVADLARR